MDPIQHMLGRSARIQHFDNRLLGAVRRFLYPAARLALFVVFAWFGGLKVAGVSPANPLVASLLDQTLPFMPFDVFNILFGLFEVLIGLLFIIPGMERTVMPLFLAHMGMTMLPLALLPSVTWQTWFVPTLEGQYILKNMVLIVLALAVAAHVSPMSSPPRQHATAKR